MLDGIRSALPFQMRVHGSDSTNSCNTSPQYVQCPPNSHLRSCLNWWYVNLECCIKWTVHERADRTELMHRKVICTKVRDGNERIVKLKEGDPQGRHVIIVDDLVQSGSTLIECQVCSVSTWTHLWEMVWSNVCFRMDDFLSPNSAKIYWDPKNHTFCHMTDLEVIQDKCRVTSKFKWLWSFGFGFGDCTSHNSCMPNLVVHMQKLLAAMGAAKVSAYVTHGVFPKRSWERFDHDNGGGFLFFLLILFPLLCYVSF